MKETIDIELFKENPQLFFSQLPEQAEAEIIEFLRFVVFKYNIAVIDKKKEEKITKKKDFLNFIENNRIKLPKDYKFNREEANER